jgi:uncharacterized repeat protein (TIGR03837 family)
LRGFFFAFMLRKMSNAMISPENIIIFCRVVDNFGDAGVCWRLARQFAAEYPARVTLWIDDLAALKKISIHIDPGGGAQLVDGVHVHHWGCDAESLASLALMPGANLVIEAFGCRIPAPFEAAMAALPQPPVWINLEYLSAESWVEGCHRLGSTQAQSSLRKYFYFPGFTPQTGGLLLECDLLVRRDAFQADPAARARFFAGCGVAIPADAQVVSLFCYPTAPVAALFAAMAANTSASAQTMVCLVPEGVAGGAVARFLGRAAVPGTHATHGALTVHVLPFMDQARYDQLLWACDINFVRGEDSFVRAQWAARPLVWQIYEQDEEAHLVKLDAFLARHLAAMSDDAATSVDAFWQIWNRPGRNEAGARAEISAEEIAEIAAKWQQFHALAGQLTRHGGMWAQYLALNGDLAANLLQYVQEIG